MHENNLDFLVALSPEEQRRSEALKAQHGLSDKEAAEVMSKALKRIFGKDHCVIKEFLGLEESL